MKAEGMTLNSICTDLNISKASLNRWRKDLPDTALQDLSGLDTESIVKSGVFCSVSSADFNTNHSGPSGFLDDIADELIRHFMEWRDRGMPVTRFALDQKATQLKPSSPKGPIMHVPWSSLVSCTTTSSCIAVLLTQHSASQSPSRLMRCPSLTSFARSVPSAAVRLISLSTWIRLTFISSSPPRGLLM